MKIRFAIIFAILLTGQANSQSTFPIQIKYEGRDAFVISARQMDSVNVMAIRFQKAIADQKALIIEKNYFQGVIDRIRAEMEVLELEISTWEQEYALLEDRYALQKERHQIELDYQKEKAKGKFETFLFGTSVGGLIIAILLLIK